MKFNKHSECQNCPLNKEGNVWGIGDIPNDVMFVGRDPGEEEVLLSKPFVGKSGKFLTLKMFNAKITISILK